MFTSDSVFSVNISKSMYIGDTTMWLGQDTLHDVSIQLYQNNQLADIITEQTNTRPYYGFLLIPSNYRSVSFMPAPGKHYTINVEAAGFAEAYATTYIPQVVAINVWIHVLLGFPELLRIGKVISG